MCSEGRSEEGEKRQVAEWLLPQPRWTLMQGLLPEETSGTSQLDLGDVVHTLGRQWRPGGTQAMPVEHVASGWAWGKTVVLWRESSGK